MKEDAYVAGQIERALHGDPRTHELGVRVEVDGDDLVLHGQVTSQERRRLVARVADEQAPGLSIRNEVRVTEVPPPPVPDMLTPPVPDVLPLPEEVAPSLEVPPPHQASS